MKIVNKDKLFIGKLPLLMKLNGLKTAVILKGSETKNIIA